MAPGAWLARAAGISRCDLRAIVHSLTRSGLGSVAAAGAINQLQQVAIRCIALW